MSQKWICLELASQIQTVDAGYIDVQQDQVGHLFRQKLKSHRAVVRLQQLITFCFDDTRYQNHIREVIFNGKYFL